jgi:hypothetical protein
MMIVKKNFRHGRQIFLMNLVLTTAFTGSCKTENQGEAKGLITEPPIPMRIDEPGPTETGVELDEALGEKLFPNEANSIMEISDFVSTQIKKRRTSIDNNLGDRAIRDAHPKAHGCVRADFKVADNIPENLAKGVFSKGGNYKAWIRFSNGSPNPLIPDAVGDARGMAIKLVGVEGNKIMTADSEKHTQDFVMISSPTFVSADPSKYLKVQQAISEAPMHPLDAGSDAIHGLESGSIAAILRIQTKKIKNPLTTQYWSMVPYRLGSANDPQKQAIKFSAKPCGGESLGLPISTAPLFPDFLKVAMAKSLKSGDACFDFMVQVKKDSMSTENSIIEWPTSQSEFIPVARITIEHQKFDSKEQATFCDNLAFTPWHSLEEHRPLGAINRVRRPLYETISKKRHEINGAAIVEPDGTETF